MKHMQDMNAVRQSEVCKARNEHTAKSLLWLTAQAFDKLFAGPIKAGMTLLPRKRSYAAISFLISSQQGSRASASQESATSHTFCTAGVKPTLPLRTCEYHVMNCLAQTAAMQIGQHRKEEDTNAYNTMLKIQLWDTKTYWPKSVLSIWLGQDSSTEPAKGVESHHAMPAMMDGLFDGEPGMVDVRDAAGQLSTWSIWQGFISCGVILHYSVSQRVPESFTTGTNSVWGVPNVITFMQGKATISIRSCHMLCLVKA